MSEVHQELMARLEAYPWTEGMEIPPPVVRELEGEFLEVAPGESITARWPVLERHLGPAGAPGRARRFRPLPPAARSG